MWLERQQPQGVSSPIVLSTSSLLTFVSSATGTRNVEARAIIASCELPILSAQDLESAASKAVQVSRIMQLAREANFNVRISDKIVVHDADPKGPVIGFT